MNRSDQTIEFRNGSQLAIFAADRAEDADKLRGGERSGHRRRGAAVPALDYFVDNVAEAMPAKPHGVESGELWLTGTPLAATLGAVLRITRSRSRGPRKAGWDVHEWAVIDNPYFGATAEERWDDSAGATLIAAGASTHRRRSSSAVVGQEWTTGDALVYAVHAKPPPKFSAVRVDRRTGAYDHRAAVADHRRSSSTSAASRKPIRWVTSRWAPDFGYRPDPFAWVLWA